MTRNDDINTAYFKWLCDIVCGHRYSKQVSFKKLLTRLHSIEFTYLIPRDQNRAEAGIDLRTRFTDDTYELRGPCSVLEMMVALAIECEESIMDNPNVGDRTGQWFWGMIVNLGLGSMIDTRFDREYVDEVIERFLNREYEADGHGGLFTVRNAPYDMRDAEIFYQLCWYLDNIT